MSECGINIAKENPDIDNNAAEQLAQRIANMARDRAEQNGGSVSQAVDDIQARLEAQEKAHAAVQVRNYGLALDAKQRIKDYVGRFANPGQGIMALLEGSPKMVPGARRSIDYQIRATNGQYFGRLVAELEQKNVLGEFRRNEKSREIYDEMGRMERGEPAKDKTARTIAESLDGITKEMVARQNRAGAYLDTAPGYVMRQTHNQDAIRAAGGDPTNKRTSYQAWRDFVLPLIDREKTFEGVDPEKALRIMHNNFYTGIHGSFSDQANPGFAVGSNFSAKVSADPRLYFTDSDAAWKYNDRFGTKDVRQQVITDIKDRARAIGLMENLGPTPNETLAQTVREIQETHREGDDSTDMLGSINPARIDAAMRTLTGENEIPNNPTMARISSNVRALTGMAKMGGVFLSKLFGDKAFLQSEMMFQGMSSLQTLGAQITGLAARSGESRRMLQLMGVAMDGMMGNAMSRYSTAGMVGPAIDRAQRAFFDMNFLNYWTDVHKATAGELMAAHLGQHADLPISQLPERLRNTLSLYDIGANEWNFLRKTAHDDGRGNIVITPDLIKSLGLSARDAEHLETSLRTYFQDRIDYAVPTPGGAERRLATADTQAGTPLGEAVRMAMMFKSFPITIMNKVIQRELYGRGAANVIDFIKNDHAGKFNLAMLAAMSTTAGYLGMTVKDAIQGKTPRELMTDGKINWDVINESAIRGGGLGLMGDMTMRDYTHQTSSLLENAAGPILGQADKLAEIGTKLKHGESVANDAGKLAIDNTPFINLFYTRPILDYYVLWNMHEMLSPGYISRMQENAQTRGHQRYYVNPHH